jgi:hypothetical protein
MDLISTYSNIYPFFSRLFPINKPSIMLFLPSIPTINLNSTLLFLPSLLLLLQHSLCRLLSLINKQSRNQDCFTSTRSLITDHNQITFKRLLIPHRPEITFASQDLLLSDPTSLIPF